MHWLLSRFRSLGGATECRRVAAVEELAACDVLVNCSGACFLRRLPLTAACTQAGQLGWWALGGLRCEAPHTAPCKRGLQWCRAGWALSQAR